MFFPVRQPSAPMWITTALTGGAITPNSNPVAAPSVGGEPDERFAHKLPDNFPFRVLAFFAAKGLPWMVVGSRAICDPIPPTADTDILVYNPYMTSHWWSKWRRRKEAKEIPRILKELGFREETEYSLKQLGGCKIWWNKEENCQIIMATTERDFRKFAETTRFAARLNIQSRFDRIKFFEMAGVGR